MTLPLALGTLLRQRYLVQEILGQGGFGRTYLVLDQERFNESCVLKEFLVQSSDRAMLEKAKGLFQREASTLYQIQHPQVPRFWAAFEDEQRLFLVQSYVQGQTYRQVLSDRKRQGRSLTEFEVLHLLNHLLPVLVYLHDRGIIHRDISPENIILQPLDSASEASIGLPVLIDFGAVKEATGPATLTRIGKVGYAPPEQLQAGVVLPSSDLYALAVTSLVLLTGQEPQDLFDSETLTWKRSAFAHVSEGLAALLWRMLASYPGDRVASAQQVLAELPSISEPSQPTQLTPIAPDPATTRQPESDLAIGPAAVVTEIHRAVRSGQRRRTIAVVGLIGLGIAAPLLWRSWITRVETPGNLISSMRSTQLGDRPATSKPAIPIQFPPGKVSTLLQGTLQANEIQPYLLTASQGQVVAVTLSGNGVMNLLRSSQDAIDVAASQTRSWTGQLPADEQYQIQVIGSGSYSLDVALSPIARPIPEQTQHLSFAPGTAGTSVTGTLAPNQLRRYLLNARSGQILVIKVLQGAVKLSTIAPDGQRLTSTTPTGWQGRLLGAGDYVVEVSTTQPGVYALAIEVF